MESATRAGDPEDKAGPLLLRPRDVARLLGLSRAMVYKLAYSGELRSIRVGSAVRIPAAEVLRVADEGTGPRV